MNKHQKTLHLTQLALLVALELVVGLTPLGFILIPPVSITLLHIPVIIGAILLGPVDGAVLGLIMGATSIFKATTAATSPIDIAFSPFLSGKPVASLLLALVGRVLLGLCAAWLFRLLSKTKLPQALSIAAAAVVSSLVHSCVVLGLLALLFPELGVTLLAVLAAVLSINTLLEVVVAGVIATGVCKPMLAFLKRRG